MLGLELNHASKMGPEFHFCEFSNTGVVFVGINGNITNTSYYNKYQNGLLLTDVALWSYASLIKAIMAHIAWNTDPLPM